ncbi:hypothetical protein [Williamwhitmania taraxaci]|uniref:Uncharacterized protein n=1 Tax=Williamwhitmania taraxaci TaxID=1640674 RepID=A0A1G6KA65_9BACT|nr:hypothetical protein [Williamwhitmania taraxaci]SDC27952.1 hypothetical protein SAMN05216323_10245 [Williamwhitmania taraxaci]
MEIKIAITIDASLAQTTIDTVTTVENSLPMLINLTNDDRHNLAKMGDKTLAFVTKTLEYAKQNPSVVPAFLNVAEFENNVTTVNNLSRMQKPLRQLIEEIDDTTLYVGSEAYTDALTFYTALKGAAKANVPGMKSVYDDLQARFPGRGKGTPPTPRNKKNNSKDNTENDNSDEPTT